MPAAPSPATYDLHLHTVWSYDATAEAEMYFCRARELGIRCIAITEHHNLDSAEEARQVAERYPDIRLIVAAELSVTTSIGSVDLLCYNLPCWPRGALASVLEQYRGWQQRCGAAFCDGMRRLGHDYTDEHRLELLRTYRPERVLVRQGATHVKNALHAQYLVQRGFMADMSDYGPLQQAVAEAVELPPYPDVAEVVPAVKAAGGLVAIAHPSGYFRGDDRKRMDALREECSLDGIECAHFTVDPALTVTYRNYCKAHGLFSVGGSDAHDPAHIEGPLRTGTYSTARRFGCHIGAAEWFDEFAERL